MDIETATIDHIEQQLLPRTRTQPIIRTVKADVGSPHADVPILST